MNTREEMLARMRRSQPAPVALPELPAFAQGGGAAAAGFDAFCEALQRMGGKIAPAPAGGDADAAVRALFPDAKVICSATPEVRGTRKCEVICVIGEPRALRESMRTNTPRCSVLGMIFSMPMLAI